MVKANPLERRKHMKDIILDTLFDSLKLLPFLFVAFLFIEIIEHKFSTKTNKLIEKSGKLGPFLGSALGLVPQCGFSVVATNFYVTRIISLGTLIAIYLSTSDEMLPILLSEQVDGMLILKIMGIKFLVGLVFGYLIDFLLRKRKKETNIHALCDDSCDCKHSLFQATLKHTFKTFLFIFLITFLLNAIFHYFGEEVLSKLLLKESLFSPFLTSLIGLIPNCASSVILTELYLNEAIHFGALMSGLLSCSGVAIMLLWRENKNKKENLSILGITYAIAVVVGILLEMIG